MVGTTVRNGQATLGKDGKASEMPLSFYVGMMCLDMTLRAKIILSLFIAVVPCLMAATWIVRMLQPMVGLFLALVPATMVMLIALTVMIGVVFARLAQTILHPSKEGKTDASTVSGMCFMHYLQSISLAQAFTLAPINGSWLAALLHKCVGADTSLDTCWFSYNVRDHCMLKVEEGAVIDRDAHLAGHVGQPGSTILCQKSSIAANANIHPHGIMLAGQWLGAGATLDSGSHAHWDKLLTDNMFWSGSPARTGGSPRINDIRLDQEIVPGYY